MILQLSETECGIACLAILFSFYELNLPLEELREMCGTSRDGSKLVTLMRVARQQGFLAEAFKMDIDAIKILREPVIAFWRFNHFVVIEGVGHNQVFMNDPTQGRISVSLEDFDKYFTGVILSITPTSIAAKQPSLPVLKTILKEWLADFKLELAFLLMTLLLIISSPLLNSVLNNIFIDQGVVASRIDWIPYISGFSVAVSLILGFSTCLQKWNQFKLCVHASLSKTAQIIQHTLRLPLLFFSLRHKTEIISLLSRTEGAVHLFFNSAVNLAVGLIAVFFVCFS